MIEARIRKTYEALNSLDEARKLGKPEHLCLIQEAFALVVTKTPDKKKIEELLLKAKNVLPNDDYYDKSMSEIDRIHKMLQTRRTARD
jgi:hypothetical protein